MSSDAEQIERRYRAHPGWHVFGAVLVAAWLAAMASMFWPIERVEAAMALDRTDLAAALADDDTWMAAYSKDRKIGYVHSRIELGPQRTLLHQESHLRVSVAGLTQEVRSDLDVELGPDQRLVRLDLGMRAGPMALKAEGRMVPEGLALTIDMGGRTGRRVLPMHEAPLFDLTLPYLLAKRNPQPGDRFRVELFDPQTLSMKDSVVEVIGPEAVQAEGGRLVPAMHLRRQAAGLRLDTWVDARGRVYKEQVEGGLTLLRTDEQEAARAPSGPTADAPSVPGAAWLEGLIPPKPARGAPTP